MRKKVLLVDAFKETRNKTHHCLTQSGYEVVTATNAPEAFWVIDTERPDIVLIDIEMMDMCSFDICRIIKESENSHLLPIILISKKDYQNDILIGMEVGADDYIISPYNDRELLSRIKNALRRVALSQETSALTRLPGSSETYRKLTSLLIKNKEFAAIYIDIDDLRHFNGRYGYFKGDILIKLLAEIIISQTQAHGDESDFVGHLGKDDFVLLTTMPKAEIVCESIANAFDQKVRHMLSEEDIENGYFTVTNRRGELQKHPLTSVSLAIVPCLPYKFANAIQITETAGSLKQKLKSMPGSNYLVDKRG